MIFIDIDNIVLEWIKTNNNLQGYVFFNWLEDENNSHAIKTIPTEQDKSSYLGGFLKKTYDFSLDVILNYSKDKDNTNTNAMKYTREWQNWLEEQELNKNYPNFGENCSNYQIEVLTGTPYTMQNENTAQYHFYARINYVEKKKRGLN